jgi:hypothetical protein
MPAGTEFEVKLKEPGMIFKNITLLGNGKGKRKTFVNSKIDESLKLCEDYINAIFIPIQKPVSFMEVVKSNKRCKVELGASEYILDFKYEEGDSYISEGFRKIRKGEYMELCDLLLVISRFVGNNEFKDIIENGKWYIESEESKGE